MDLWYDSFMLNFESMNPYIEKNIKQYNLISSNDLNSIIDDLSTGFNSWALNTFSERAFLFVNVSKLLISNKEQFSSHLISPKFQLAYHHITF